MIIKTEKIFGEDVIFHLHGDLYFENRIYENNVFISIFEFTGDKILIFRFDKNHNIHHQSESCNIIFRENGTVEYVNTLIYPYSYKIWQDKKLYHIEIKEM